VLHELADVVSRQDPGGVLDPPEEARHVLDLGLLARVARARHPAEPAAVREELVEKLPGPKLRRQSHEALELLHQASDRLGPLGREGRAELGGLVEAAEHVEEPAVPAVRMRPAAGQVDGRHREDLLRSRKVIEAHRIVRTRDHPQERDAEADLGPAVETLVARERPRNPVSVERAKERVGIRVGADQDREVPVCASSRLHLVLDGPGDGVGLLGDGLVGRVHGLGPHPLLGRPELLVDSLGLLKPFGIVVLDEPVSHVQDALA
jgi:hypothetical protein